jgi:Flp pilus assembly pilin Flp
MLKKQAWLIIQPGGLAKERERGASLVEYALLVALIAIVTIASVRSLGRNVSQQFSVIGGTLSG